MSLEHPTKGCGHLEPEEFTKLNTGAGATYTEQTINSRLQEKGDRTAAIFQEGGD